MDGLVDINTLSPNENFWYKIQKPFDATMGNFVSRIAFFDINEKLIYHRKDAFAHWLKPWHQIEFVKWSRQGNMAYFYEFKINSIYDSVFLNLKDEISFRIDERKNDFAIVESLNLRNWYYDENEVLQKLESLKIFKRSLYTDPVNKSLLDRIVNRNNWYP